MIASLYTVDFLSGGQTIRLLSPGDILLAEPEVKITQSADTFTPIGSAWGEPAATGGTVTTMTWSVIRQHVSHAAARAACMVSAGSLPSGVSGSLKIVVTAGDSAVITGVICVACATSQRVPCIGGQTITVYTVQGGALSYVSATPLEPAVMPDAGQLAIRVVEDDVGNGPEKWIEVGYSCEDAYGLTGDATTGWKSVGDLVRISILRSENMLTWTVGEMTDAPGSPEPAETGWHTYWSRSIYPIDSSVKYGQITARNSGDARNNPILSLAINGVILDLPNYPYSMPSDAAQMQADIRAAGWAGASVSATTALDWEMSIPDVDMSGYGVGAYVSWPTWDTYDPMGNPVTVSGQTFNGNFVNSVGRRTAVPRQFFRLKLSAL